MNYKERDALFAKWVETHRSILYHVAQAFASNHDQQDLMQEILVALWRSASNFKGSSKEQTFIYRVAHNTALMWHRSERKRRRHLDAAHHVEWFMQSEEGQTASRLKALYAAIRTLPPLDRSLMLLSLDGLNYQEIAGIHNLTESNVGARLSRTRKRLSQQLKSQLADE